jgi:hypothetical protein
MTAKDLGIHFWITKADTQVEVLKPCFPTKVLSAQEQLCVHLPITVPLSQSECQAWYVEQELWVCHNPRQRSLGTQEGENRGIFRSGVLKFFLVGDAWHWTLTSQTQTGHPTLASLFPSLVLSYEGHGCFVPEWRVKKYLVMHGLESMPECFWLVQTGPFTSLILDSSTYIPSQMHWRSFPKDKCCTMAGKKADVTMVWWQWP